MKKKSTPIIAIAICLMLLVSIFSACNPENGSEDTSNADTEYSDEIIAEPVTVGKADLISIVKEALGDEAKDFNGDLSALTAEQLKKVEALASKKGLILDMNDGKPVLKDPSHQEASFDEYKEILNKAGVTSVDKLSKEEYEKVSAIAAKEGMTAVTTPDGKVDIIKPTTTKAASTVKTKKQNNKKTESNTIKGGYAPRPTAGYVEPIGTTLVRTKLASNTFKVTYPVKSQATFKKSAITHDNCVVCVGSSFENANKVATTSISGLIAKYDGNGKLLWSKVISANEDVEFGDVAIYPDGSIIVVGNTYATDFVSDSEYKCKDTIDGFVIKFNSKGEKLWTKMYGGSGDELFASVASTPDGGFVVGGTTTSKDGDFKDLSIAKNAAIVFKCGADGSILWRKAYNCSVHASADAIAVNSSGSIYVCLNAYLGDGDFGLISGMSPENGGTAVAKLGQDGSTQWIKAYSDNGSTEFSSLTIAKDGGCVIGGTYCTGKKGSSEVTFKGIYNGGLPGSFDAVSIKILPSGKTDWISQLAGLENEEICGVSSVPGGYAVVGYSTSSNRDFAGNSGKNDAFLYILNEYGEKQTYALFGGSGEDCAEFVCGNGGTTVYVIGSSDSVDGYFADCGINGGNNLTPFLFRYDLQQ